MKLGLRPLFLLVAAFLLLGNVTACFDDDIEVDPDTIVLPFAFEVGLTEQSAGALVGLTFTFPSGEWIHPNLTGTGIIITWTSATSVEIEAIGVGEATANVTYGSCNFTVTSSTIGFLPVGSTFKAVQCQMDIMTLNLIGIGSSGEGTLTLTFDGDTSTEQTVIVGVNSDGSVTVNGVVVGVITGDGTVTGTGGG